MDGNRFNNARRRSRTRLHFIQSSRNPNVAAVVRPQAPLPAASIIPPPPDASQTSHWDQFVPSGTQQLQASDLVALGRSDLYLASLQDLSAPLEDVEEETSAGGGSGDVDDLGLRPPSTLYHHFPQPWKSLEVSSSNADLTVSPQAPSPAVVSPVRQLSTIEPTTEVVADYDCPLRAGPDGHLKCAWQPPRGNVNGFPSLARVKEHVGSHGLLCPDCDQVFTVPTRYKDHRRSRQESGVCGALGMHKSNFPNHIQLPPDVILAYFVRPAHKDGKSAWLSGYKILHPNWHSEGHLASPSYRHNTSLQGADQHLHGFEAVASSRLPTVGQPDITGSSGQRAQRSDTLGVPSALHQTSFAYVGHTEQRNQPITSTSDHPRGTEFSQTGDEEMFWISDGDVGSMEVDDLGYAQDSGLLNMSGALTNPVHATTGSSGISPLAPETTSGRHPGAANVSSSLTASILPQGSWSATTAKAAVQELHMREASRSTSQQRGRSQEGKSVDSAVHMKDSQRSSGAPSNLPKAAHGTPTPEIGGPSRSRVSTPARKIAMKRVERLMAQVLELHTKIQTLGLENRSLHVRVGEIGCEKEKLEMILVKIRMELLEWEDASDEEMIEMAETLSASMQNIERLLSD
ncbi:hypothetical protein LTR53_012398 [Teratosphaeriaceae sp. CCFEE 6253]|nr:hypothetical protein LTR53_012398 [Teratosphaeriaceae sp. CCFEE 6253]